jgi:predicted Zn-dependent protease
VSDHSAGREDRHGQSSSNAWCVVGDARIRQVKSADYSDYVAEAAIASTTGSTRHLRERSGAYVSVEAIANDGGDDQTGWGL